MNKTRFIKFTVLAAVLLVSVLVFTGCVRGMTPVGWSGVAITENFLYTGSKEGRLVSFNTTTSALDWSEPITITTSGGFGCGSSTTAAAIYGTPATANGLVFIAAYNGEVDAFAADTLEQRWVYPRRTFLEPIIGSIVVHGDTLYFGCTDGSVYGLDTLTGDKKWQFTTGGEIWSTPAISNNRLFIGSFDKKIYAVDIPSQSKVWEFPTGATNVAPPVTLNGIVYVGSLDRTLYALRESDGSEAWRFTGGNWFWAKPVIHNGIVFAPNLDNHIYGLDALTGEKVLDYDLGGQVASWPVVVNNQVIAATEDGVIFSLGTDRTNPVQRQITRLPQNVIVNSPLTARNDTVYINGSDNVVYPVNLTTGQVASTIALRAQ